MEFYFWGSQQKDVLHRVVYVVNTWRYDYYLYPSLLSSSHNHKVTAYICKPVNCCKTTFEGFHDERRIELLAQPEEIIGSTCVSQARNLQIYKLALSPLTRELAATLYHLYQVFQHVYGLCGALRARYITIVVHYS